MGEGFGVRAISIIPWGGALFKAPLPLGEGFGVRAILIIPWGRAGLFISRWGPRVDSRTRPYYY
ncbi:hypothetical protein NIES39_L06690 [Arthrospira platensis NIES-39]|nr:hypothetical protein NIES39_L06690 [Arthrospira platensis NIES-39]